MYVACLYGPGSKWQPGMPVSEQPLEKHVIYMLRLHGEGLVAIAGPLPSSEGGLNVFNVQSLDQARVIVHNDPAITEGVCVLLGIYEWAPLLIQGLPDTNQVTG